MRVDNIALTDEEKRYLNAAKLHMDAHRDEWGNFSERLEHFGPDIQRAFIRWYHVYLENPELADKALRETYRFHAHPKTSFDRIWGKLLLANYMATEWVKRLFGKL